MLIPDGVTSNPRTANCLSKSRAGGTRVVYIPVPTFSSSSVHQLPQQHLAERSKFSTLTPEKNENLLYRSSSRSLCCCASKYVEVHGGLMHTHRDIDALPKANGNEPPRDVGYRRSAEAEANGNEPPRDIKYRRGNR